jgi:hypothetical protein
MNIVRLIFVVLVLAILAPAQTVVKVPFSYVSDSEAAVAIGLTHEAIPPTCGSGVVKTDKCNTEFDQNYWRFSRCQTGADHDCLFPDIDQPCDTREAHPGEWWLPINTNNMIAGDNVVNLSLVEIQPGQAKTWTTLMMPITAITIKHSHDTRFNVDHPTQSDKNGYGALTAYINNDNYASIAVGTEPNGQTMIYALSKENANYWLHWKKTPIVLDGPDGVNFTGTLAIERIDHTYTYKYTRDLVITPNTQWTIVWTRIAGFGTPGFAGFYTFNGATSSTACVHSGGFVYEAPAQAQASIQQGPIGQANGDRWGDVTSVSQGPDSCFAIEPLQGKKVKLQGDGSTRSALFEGDQITCTDSTTVMNISARNGHGQRYSITANLGTITLLAEGQVRLANGVLLTSEAGSGGTGTPGSGPGCCFPDLPPPEE